MHAEMKGRTSMIMIRSRIGHAVLLAPLAVLAMVGGAIACSSPSEEGGVATAQTNGAAAADASWAAYDAAMNEFAACLRNEGWAGVKYEGHKAEARGHWDELSGVPDTSNRKINSEADALAFPDAKCVRGDGPEPFEGVRPQPYVAPKPSIAELAEQRAWAKCMRNRGFDVKDPDPDPDSNTVGDNAKAGQDPKFDQAAKLCSTEVGIPAERRNG